MNVAAIPREFKELPLVLIDAPQLPSRSAMDDALMDELVASVRANGLLQPMSVARVGERFEVVAGHRRRIACERAGLVVAPCIVYPSRDAALDAVQFAENRHREDLSAADEAIWFAELLDKKCDGNIETLCGLVGEKLSYVNNRLCLFHGDTDVFAALQRGDIKIGVAQELNKWPEKYWRNYYLDLAVRGGATVSLVAGCLQEWKQNFGHQAAAPPSAAASEPSMSDATEHPFTCVVCGKHDNVHLIRQVNIHQHCDLAILRPLLANARGESS